MLVQEIVKIEELRGLNKKKKKKKKQNRSQQKSRDFAADIFNGKERLISLLFLANKENNKQNNTKFFNR